jgi:hypothetical protein
MLVWRPHAREIGRQIATYSGVMPFKRVICRTTGSCPAFATLQR